jgi:hypothetical protein
VLKSFLGGKSKPIALRGWIEVQELGFRHMRRSLACEKPGIKAVGKSMPPSTSQTVCEDRDVDDGAR